MKRTRLPSWHATQEGVQKDGSPRLGSRCYGRTSTPCTNAPARRRRATDGEVHMVFPRSGPGRPIRALLAGRGDMEFAIANVSEAWRQVKSSPQALRSCGGCACRGAASPAWWTSRTGASQRSAGTSAPRLRFPHTRYRKHSRMLHATTRQRVSGAFLDLLATTSQAERRF